MSIVSPESLIEGCPIVSYLFTLYQNIVITDGLTDVGGTALLRLIDEPMHLTIQCIKRIV